MVSDLPVHISLLRIGKIQIASTLSRKSEKLFWLSVPLFQMERYVERCSLTFCVALPLQKGGRLLLS